ncbi:DNA-3-methyladenine glycosylase [Pseudomonas sp. 2FG]|uniref:DNA-3-methyladenine glycosylase family protein n=1 Tax=Pseudomonas sp. 2FG TaxID=2502191 RepID=UPI002114D16E|nr:DNA-3-methyladenine glycosylase [Pseudomonas sp. 2FG]
MSDFSPQPSPVPAQRNEPMRLPYLEPWSWQQFQQYFALRCLPEVERLTPHGYQRNFRLGTTSGWFKLRPLADEAALELSLSPSASSLTQPLVTRVRRMFDLDADTSPIAAHLRTDPLLAPLVERYPGLRLPTAFDPFEQAVRAIVGQQVTVKAAVTITGRLVTRLGDTLADASAEGPQRLFPTAEAIAASVLDGIGMPGRRVETLQRFARAVHEGGLALHADDGVEALVGRLCALPGIGPWTAEYIALRAFGVADAFPVADLGLLKARIWGDGGISARTLAARAEAWRPWRAYAAMYLWQSYAED